MCNLGGIVLIKRKRMWRKGKWCVEIWEAGKAPEHDHFALQPGDQLQKVGPHWYPDLSKFKDGEGILIGPPKKEPDFDMIADYFRLDGVSLLI